MSYCHKHQTNNCVACMIDGQTTELKRELKCHAVIIVNNQDRQLLVLRSIRQFVFAIFVLLFAILVAIVRN